MIYSTVRDLYDFALSELTSFSPTARLDCDRLFEAICGMDFPSIVAHGERICSDVQVERIKQAVERRKSGEPIAYIIGKKSFFMHDFSVSPGVLVPRPETELLVEYVIAEYRKNSFTSLLDMCTGSGCIGISVASECDIQLTLSDISETALRVAKKNAERILEGGNYTVIHSDLFASLSGRYDCITVNPPYLSDDDMKHRDLSVQYEPETALAGGGEEGVDIIAKIIRSAHKYLQKNGFLIVEIGAGQLPAVRALPRPGLSNPDIVYDYAGIPRHLVFRTCFDK